MIFHERTSAGYDFKPIFKLYVRFPKLLTFILKEKLTFRINMIIHFFSLSLSL